MMLQSILVVLRSNTHEIKVNRGGKYNISSVFLYDTGLVCVIFVVCVDVQRMPIFFVKSVYDVKNAIDMILLYFRVNTCSTGFSVK